MPTAEETFKAELLGKFPTKESWVALAAKHANSEFCIKFRASTGVFGNTCLFPDGSTMYTTDLSGTGQQWWAGRELVRQNNVYQQSDLLRYLSSSFKCLARMIPHPSTEQKGMVAYTASDADGERDVQRVSTIGRWLRKSVVCLSDAFLQRVEQEWAAECDDSFFTARTGDEIEAVYTDVANVVSCMRYRISEHFDHRVRAHGIHPTRAYEAPGLGVAYLKDPAGHVKARAVIFENPSEPGDKRFIRVYGAPQLRTKLIRAGYKEGSLVGACLKAIKLPIAQGADSDDGVSVCSFVVPYLDPGTTRDGVAVQYTDADDGLLRIVDFNHSSRASSTGQYGISTLTRFETSYICGLTGRKCDATSDPKVNLLTANGWVKAAKSSLVDTPLTRVLTQDNAANSAGFVRDDERDTLCTKVDDFGDTRFAPRAELHALVSRARIHKLDQARYSQGAENGYQYTTRRCVTDSRTRTWIMQDDAVRWVTDEGELSWTHNSVAGETGRSKPVVQLSPIHRVRVYGMRANPCVLRTDTGAYVTRRHHDIRRCTDGQYRFSRSVSVYYVLGDAVFTKVGAAQIVNADIVDQLIRSAVEGREPAHYAARLESRLHGDAVGYGSVFERSDGTVGSGHDVVHTQATDGAYRAAIIEQAHKGAKRVVASDPADTAVAYVGTQTRRWAAAFVLSVERIKVFLDAQVQPEQAQPEQAQPVPVAATPVVATASNTSTTLLDPLAERIAQAVAA